MHAVKNSTGLAKVIDEKGETVLFLDTTDELRRFVENEVAAGTVILPATGARRLQGEELAALKRRECTERARARFDR